MDLRKLIPFLFAVLLTHSASGQVSFATATAYDDYIFMQGNTFQKTFRSYMLEIVSPVRTVHKIDSAGNVCDTMLRNIIGRIKKMPAWKGDSTYRDAALKMFAAYQEIMAREFAEVKSIMMKSPRTDAENKRLDELQAEIEIKENAAYTPYANSQDDFLIRYQ